MERALPPDFFGHTSGRGAPAIAATLTDDGVPTATPGARWHATQINRILRNETYKGTWWSLANLS